MVGFLGVKVGPDLVGVEHNLGRGRGGGITWSRKDVTPNLNMLLSVIPPAFRLYFAHLPPLLFRSAWRRLHRRRARREGEGDTVTTSAQTLQTKLWPPDQHRPRSISLALALRLRYTFANLETSLIRNRYRTHHGGADSVPSPRPRLHPLLNWHTFCTASRGKMGQVSLCPCSERCSQQQLPILCAKAFPSSSPPRPFPLHYSTAFTVVFLTLASLTTFICRDRSQTRALPLLPPPLQTRLTLRLSMALSVSTRSGQPRGPRQL